MFDLIIMLSRYLFIFYIVSKDLGGYTDYHYD